MLSPSEFETLRYFPKRINERAPATRSPDVDRESPILDVFIAETGRKRKADCRVINSSKVQSRPCGRNVNVRKVSESDQHLLERHQVYGSYHPPLSYSPAWRQNACALFAIVGPASIRSEKCHPRLSDAFSSHPKHLPLQSPA